MRRRHPHHRIRIRPAPRHRHRLRPQHPHRAWIRRRRPSRNLDVESLATGYRERGSGLRSVATCAAISLAAAALRTVPCHRQARNACGHHECRLSDGCEVLCDGAGRQSCRWRRSHTRIRATVARTSRPRKATTFRAGLRWRIRLSSRQRPGCQLVSPLRRLVKPRARPVARLQQRPLLEFIGPPVDDL